MYHFILVAFVNIYVADNLKNYFHSRFLLKAKIDLNCLETLTYLFLFTFCDFSSSGFLSQKFILLVIFYCNSSKINSEKVSKLVFMFPF